MSLISVTAPTLKKIKMNAEALHTTKLKDEKAAKAKKGKGKGASLKFGTERVSADNISCGIVHVLTQLLSYRISLHQKLAAVTRTLTTSCDT